MADNKRILWALIFLSPALLLLAVFLLGPVFASIVLAFHEWDLLTPPTFIGFKNFTYLVTDPDFTAALKHTLSFIIGYTPSVIILGLITALIMNQKIPGRSILRAFFFLPVVSSWVAVALLWRWLLNPKFGLINFILGLAGITGPSWLYDPNWAMEAIIMTSVWKDIGFVMMIFLGGLQNIPRNYYEAASIDGAGPLRRVAAITIPLLSPTTFFVLTISLINSFQVFEQVWVMTQGGPAGATTVLVQQIYLYAARYGEMGYASAQSIVLFLLIFLVTVFQMKFQKRWVHYEE